MGEATDIFMSDELHISAKSLRDFVALKIVNIRVMVIEV